MVIDTKVVADLFGRLGAALARPTVLCLIGSTPGIAAGQPDRQTPDINVWHPGSDYDAADLSAACRQAGVLYDPKGDLEPGKIYIQVIRPGIVTLPDEFAAEKIGRYGNLTLVIFTLPRSMFCFAARLRLSRAPAIGSFFAKWPAWRSPMRPMTWRLPILLCFKAGGRQ